MFGQKRRMMETRLRVWEAAVFLAVLVLAALWFLFLRPPALGGSTWYVRVTGDSMEPSFHSGDLVITRQQDSHSPGDVVAFRFPQHGGDAVVIHRIVGGSGDKGFLTQGDNNEGRDPWRIETGDILGRQWLHVPKAGRLIGLMQIPAMSAAIAASVAAFLVMGGGKTKASRSAKRAGRSARSQTAAARPPKPASGIGLLRLFAFAVVLLGAAAVSARRQE